MLRSTVMQRASFSIVLAIAVCATVSQMVPAADRVPTAVASDKLERIVLKQGESERGVDARVLVEAADGGLLVEATDGRLWNVEPQQLVSRTAAAKPFAALPAAALGRQLQAEVGGKAEIVTKRHYVICTTAGKPYANWVGTLFEQLYAAFQNYWKQRGFKVHDPEFPLAAIVLADEKQFAAFATKHDGADAAKSQGYYSVASNRIVLYDLTADGGGAATEADVVRKMAAQPLNIATIVHEATHQIAFNCGLHTRYADNPLWLTEGMAMFFETPDPSSSTGWRSVGKVNGARLAQFREYFAKRPADSLETLLRSDERFTNAESMPDAYAEAWALSYFLILTRKDDYVGYLQTIAGKPRLVWNQPDERLKEFRTHFGDDLRQLDAAFIRYMRRVE